MVAVGAVAPACRLRSERPAASTSIGGDETSNSERTPSPASGASSRNVSLLNRRLSNSRRVISIAHCGELTEINGVWPGLARAQQGGSGSVSMGWGTACWPGKRPHRDEPLPATLRSVPSTSLLGDAAAPARRLTAASRTTPGPGRPRGPSCCLWAFAFPTQPPQGEWAPLSGWNHPTAVTSARRRPLTFQTAPTGTRTHTNQCIIPVAGPSLSAP